MFIHLQKLRIASPLEASDAFSCSSDYQCKRITSPENFWYNCIFLPNLTIRNVKTPFKKCNLFRSVSRRCLDTVYVRIISISTLGMSLFWVPITKQPHWVHLPSNYVILAGEQTNTTWGRSYTNFCYISTIRTPNARHRFYGFSF